MPQKSPDSDVAQPPDKTLWCWLLTGIAVTAAIRGWYHFRNALVPGVDAAYYLLQARSMLERGTLYYAELPLTFWLQAGFAWLLQHASGMAQDNAIVASVKTLDTLLPPLAAIPMGLIGWRWSRAPKPSLLAVLVAIALACLSAPMLRMTGDFQKNALGHVWLATLMLSSHAFLLRPGWRTAIMPVLALGLCGATHVGVLGSAIVFSITLLCFSALMLDRKALVRLLLLSVASGAVVLGVCSLVVLKFQTAQFTKLFNGFSAPFTSNATQTGQGHRPIFQLLPAIPSLILAASVARVAWRERTTLPAADRALALASAFTAAILVMFDREGRLILIAVLPTAVAISFLLANIQRPRVLKWIGGTVLALAVISGALMPGPRPMLDDDAATELKSLAQFTDPAGTSIVVTRHGLEFWTAWILRTAVSQPGSLRADYWEKYANVYYLSEKRDGPMFRDMPPMGGSGGPPDRRPPPMPPMSNRPDDPMRGAEIPKDAEIVHDGVYFKMARVKELPGRLK